MEQSKKHGVLVRAGSGPGVLYDLSGVIARHRGDISSVEIFGHSGGEAHVYFEIELPSDPAPLIVDLRSLSVVRDVVEVATFAARAGGFAHGRRH